MKIKFAIFVIFLQTGVLFSTTATWTGNSNANWNNAANWNPNTAFPGGAADDVANLTGATPAVTTITLNAATIILGQLNLDLGPPGYTINGGGNFNFSASSGTAVLNVTATNGNGAHTITAPITLTSPLSIFQNSTGNLTLQGAITGTPGITMFGPQTLVLSGGNNYMGGTTISGGTISITSDANLGNVAGGVSIGSGTLQFNAAFATARTFTLTGGAKIDVTGANVATITGTIGGAGSLTKTNTGTLVLAPSSPPNNYQGGTTIGSGILSIASDAFLGTTSGSLNFINGTLLTTAGITSSRSGSIGGTAVIDTNGNTDTFSGNFIGGGSLMVQSSVGAGTVILTGTNKYTNGTTVAANTTLQGTTNSLQGNINLVAGTSHLIFSQNFNGTYGGGISGSGTLQKTGTGTATFTGSSGLFTGATTVTQGGLIVNGSIASSAVNVALGALLGGVGTVGPTTNFGTLQPGDLGNFTIQGNLGLQPSSVVDIAISPLVANRIIVTGMATIDGALAITAQPGFYAPTTCYTILTSAGLLNAPPGFVSLTTNSSNFIPTVTYTATNVNLCVNALQPFFLFPFSNENTAAVGNNINALTTAGQVSADLLSVISQFAGKSFDAINEALDQMHPAPYSAFTELQAEIDAQLISLFHRMPYLPCNCSNPNRFWVEPLGASLTLKKHGMQIGSQSNTGGLALGYDGALYDNFIVGVGGAWENSSLHWHDHRGHGEVNGFYGGIYSDYQYGGFYLGGAFLGGVDFYETTRHIKFFSTDRRAKANYNAIDIVGQLATAYLFGSPAAYFYPYANLDFFYHHTNAFNESHADGLDLSVRQRTDNTLRTEMGIALQVQDTNLTETMCISPFVAIGWVNMCPVQRDHFSSTFQGASIPFRTEGWEEEWNFLAVNFGLSYSYLCYSISARYNVEFSPDKHTILFNQYGNLRLDWKW